MIEPPGEFTTKLPVALTLLKTVALELPIVTFVPLTVMVVPKLFVAFPSVTFDAPAILANPGTVRFPAPEA